MERPTMWKVVTVGVAMTGLGLVGAGAASAATTPTQTTLAAGIEAPLFPPVDWTFDSADEFFQADTYWDDTYWDD